MVVSAERIRCTELNRVKTEGAKIVTLAPPPLK
jgi:hypothetical protein